MLPYASAPPPVLCSRLLQGPKLFYVDSDGTRMPGRRFAVGSGATYAYGVLDNGWVKSGISWMRE